MADTPDKGYVVPAEGSIFWLDTWVLLADAPHPNAAYAFLDFIQHPGDPGQGDQLQQLRHAERQGQAAVDPEVLADPAVFPPDEVFALLEGSQGHLGQHAAHRHLGRVQAEARRLNEPHEPDLDHGVIDQRGATAPTGARLRSGLLTTLLLLPAGSGISSCWSLPLVIIVVFSFGTRARNGGYAPAFVFDNYARALQKPEPFITSLQMAIDRDDPVPARRPAAGLLPRDPGRPLQGRS